MYQTKDAAKRDQRSFNSISSSVRVADSIWLLKFHYLLEMKTGCLGDWVLGCCIEFTTKKKEMLKVSGSIMKSEWKHKQAAVNFIMSGKTAQEME